MAEAHKKDEMSVVRCDTTAGSFVMELHREWSPHGYDRAVELFRQGFYDSTHLFRVVPGFLVQFGITYSSSAKLRELANSQIPDDPKHVPPIPFKEGTISYAGNGKDSRTSQLFISYADSDFLGKESPWETPIGEVVEGMEHVHNFYSYGDIAPFGKGPDQGKIHSGRKYMEENFPLADRFLTCTVGRDGEEKEHTKSEFVAAGAKEKIEGSHSERVAGQLVGAGTDYAAFGAAFAIIVLVALLIFGFAGRNQKTSKTS